MLLNRNEVLVKAWQARVKFLPSEMSFRLQKLTTTTNIAGLHKQLEASDCVFQILATPFNPSLVLFPSFLYWQSQDHHHRPWLIQATFKISSQRSVSLRR
jgi:hypothetical protein